MTTIQWTEQDEAERVRRIDQIRKLIEAIAAIEFDEEEVKIDTLLQEACKMWKRYDDEYGQFSPPPPGTPRDRATTSLKSAHGYSTNSKNPTEPKPSPANPANPLKILRGMREIRCLFTVAPEFSQESDIAKILKLEGSTPESPAPPAD